MDIKSKWKSIVVWSCGDKSEATHDSESEARKTVSELILFSSVKSVSVKKVMEKSK